MPSTIDQASLRATGMPVLWRKRLARLAVAGLSAALLACGGGGGSSAGVGTGGTGSFAVGSVSGFGSVIVNGVHFDDSGADVFDDDGNSSSSSALGLGMVVEIRGSVDDDGLAGTAQSISYYSELKGPVTAVDAGAGTVTVFGEVVSVTATTVFEGVAGLAGIAVGNVVEVYGLPGASGTLVATRIEREALTVGAYDGEFRVRGPLTGLSGTAPDQRFTVASVTVTTDAGTEVEDGALVEGAYVSVRLATTAAGDGSYMATRIRVKTRSYDDDVNEAEVEGLVSEFTSPDAPFKVNGYPVQLGTSVSYEDGLAGDLADGVRVEVEGSVVDGVLIARKVEFEHEDDDGGADGSDAPFEFKGVATCSTTPCSSPSGTFEVRGVTVHYDALTRFEDGVTLANLQGSNVEVKAVSEIDSSGTIFRATRIEPND